MFKNTKIYLDNKKYFFTFLLTGIGTTLIYFGLFIFFWYALHINYLLTVSLAYVAAAAYQFLANRNITFQVKGPQFIYEILRYFMLLIINYLLALSITQLSIYIFQSPVWGLIITVFVTPLTGYLLFRYWVFKIPSMMNQRVNN